MADEAAVAPVDEVAVVPVDEAAAGKRHLLLRILAVFMLPAEACVSQPA